jgi:multisubunit Na+/H+ antiporter MnhB subunit
LALAASLLPAGYFLFTPTAYRSAHGLLFTTPWALLGLCRIPDLWRIKNPRLQTICLTLVVGLVGYALAMLVLRASSPHGGLEWGARFALSFYPLLAIAACWEAQGLVNVEAWAHIPRSLFSRSSSFLLAAFILLGIAFQARGLITIHDDKQTNHALNQALLAVPEVQVLSDLWWLPLNAAPIYPQKAFFLANTPEQMAAWLGQAGDAQFRNLSLVTLNPELPAQISQSLQSYELQISHQGSIENLFLYQVSLQPR